MSLTTNKIRIKVPKNDDTFKKRVEEKINSLYPDTALEQSYLSYDLSIEDEYKKELKEKDKSINHTLINSLPTLSSKIDITNPEDLEIEADEEKNSIADKECEYDIDLSNLEKSKVGDKTYYFDHCKGIIYDLEYNSIGHIDDGGDFVFES